MVKINVILGSTRPNRFGVQPAGWIMQQAKDVTGAEFELVDLAEVDLPLLDEPIPPSQRNYSNDHTLEWSKVIDGADGFVFVTGEYNHSIPAALKNAIDYLYHEWNYKPVTYISYGSAAGGSRAVEHLRGVAGEQKMFDLREQILMPNYWEHTDGNGVYQFTEQQAAQAKAMLENLVFWATEMKSVRHKIG
jgi:NAD(P)H-dependent FMN reductase